MFFTVDALDLTDLRNRCNLSRRQVAELLDVSMVAVNAWETGVNTPAPHRLPYLAVVLNVSLDELEAALRQARAASKRKEPVT